MTKFVSYSPSYKEQVMTLFYEEALFYKVKRPNDVKERDLDRLMSGAVLIQEGEEIKGIFSLEPHRVDASIGMLALAVTKDIQHSSLVDLAKDHLDQMAYDYINVEVAAYDFNTMDLIRSFDLDHIATMYSDLYKGGIYYDKEVYSYKVQKQGQVKDGMRGRDDNI